MRVQVKGRKVGIVEKKHVQFLELLCCMIVEIDTSVADVPSVELKEATKDEHKGGDGMFTKGWALRFSLPGVTTGMSSFV